MIVTSSLIYHFLVISTPHCIVISSHCLVCTCSRMYHAMKNFYTHEKEGRYSTHKDTSCSIYALILEMCVCII